MQVLIQQACGGAEPAFLGAQKLPGDAETVEGGGGLQEGEHSSLSNQERSKQLERRIQKSALPREAETRRAAQKRGRLRV